VLKEVNIECKAAEICGLLGVNGAGKTTLFKILLGLLTPDSGEIHCSSKGVKAPGGIIEKPALYEYLSARENLKVFARIQGASSDKKDLDQYLENVGLETERKDAVRNYSTGMKQRLGIAIAMLNNPEVLILDEPFSGLDPMGIVQLRDLILDLAKNKGLAIIISSHIVEEIRLVSDRVYVINNGQIVKSGVTAEIIGQATLQHYLCAEHLKASTVLKEYQHTFLTETGALIEIGIEEMPRLMKRLAGEGIYLTSCTPRIDMYQLFRTAQ